MLVVGVIKPIATPVPGLQVCEHLPMLARRMDRCALVRSLAHREDNHLLGIFTERDVLRLAGESADLRQVRVADVMTKQVLSIGPDDDVLAAARVMGEKRIRHVPVVQDGNILGVVGIRDVMRSLVELIWRSHDDDARATARALLERG